MTGVDLQSLEIKVARSENLPVLPQIVSQVLSLADDPNASARAMEKLIESDAAIAAKLLRVASSPIYGVGNVPSISRAIAILGMNSIRSLVVGVAYQQIISGRTEATRFDKTEFWRHSLAAAVASRIIGKMVMPAKADDLYCAGMLHDVGLLVLDRFAPNELDGAIREANDLKVPLNEAEQLLYGFDHAQIGEILAKRWGLSPTARAAIRYHHDVSEDQEHHVTTCIVAAANTLAHLCGYRNSTYYLTVDMEPPVQASINLPPEQLEIIQTVLMAEVQKAEAAFGIGPGRAA